MTIPETWYPKTDSQIDLQLTAYLDGELSEEEVRIVEQRLVADAEFLRRMQSLQKSWDLLDALPHREADASFTRSTMELVAQTAERDWKRRQGVAREWVLKIALFVAVPLCIAALSFWFARQTQRQPVEQFVRDLPIIENLDVYEKVDSVEFLSMLDENGVFQDTESFLDEELSDDQ